MQSVFTGLGITLANVSLYVFQQFIGGTTESGIPYWVFGSFYVGAVCSIGSDSDFGVFHPRTPPQR